MYIIAIFLDFHFVLFRFQVTVLLLEKKIICRG